MKMRIVRVFAAFVAAFAILSSRAEDVWFDAGIKDYGAWPASNVGVLVIEGVGTWSGTAGGELVGEAGAKALQVSSTVDRPLSFTVDNPKTVTSDIVTIRTTARMSILDADEEMVLPPTSSKCALTCARLDEENTAYFGLVKDPAGDTNVWMQLSGAVPAGESVELVFDIKEENGLKFVRYTVEGTALTLGGSEWIEVAFPDAATAGEVSSVLYSGDGEVASLAGFTEKTIPRVALTIPEAEHVKVASVKANGVLVEELDGGYQVPQGAVVVVRFEPEDATFALTKSSLKFVMGTEGRTVSADEMPSVISISSYITINEIMASNGSSLATRNGATDLDWVELYNSSDEDIDLCAGDGWYLYDNPGEAQSKWAKIEGSCVVPAHGYKIVWCDKKYDGFAADEAYSRIGLSGDGEQLFIADSKGEIVQEVDFPGMMKDVSYGVGHLERSLFGTRDAAQYRVGEGEWKSARGPVGMSAESSDDAGFTVTSYKLNRQLTSVDIALAAIRDQAWKSGTQPSDETGVRTIAYRANNQSVSFPTTYYSNFPVATEDLAVVVKGTVVIPESGLWTFSVGSDDGFRLTLGNESNSYSMEYAGTRGYGQTYSAFNMDAGAYNLELVYFDRNGGAALDLSVAKGDYTTAESGEFSTTAFHLLGTAECPVLFGGALAGFIATDVKEEMLNKASTLDWTASFAVPADELPTEVDTVRLKVRYADGLVAKLNGTEIARTAATARTAAETLVYATFEIDSTLVKAENTLEITVTNDQIDDSELYLEAQVTMQRAEDDFVYFREPTPGAANTTHGFGPMTPAVAFSEQHGYKTEPFELTLSCAEAPYSPIYYTLDGTSPTEKSTLYTGPITVSNTTCIRAAVPQDNTILQKDCAATYLFLEDILKQSPDVVPEGFPADRTVNNHAMRYGFSAKGLENDPERLRKGFEEIATMSIVVDPKNLFDKAIGIYVNPSGDGRSWERQIMLEQINPNSDDAGFSVPAGIRIRGAASRGVDHAKHSFRLFFRGEYGMGSLENDLFGDESDVEEFDKIDLRCSQNYSWANENSGSETFIHECFSRDTQGAMGDYYTKSRYYNLFINGQYWGLYQTQERGDEDFAASYNGGASGNYDVIKTSSPGYNTGANAGTEDAWKALWEMIVNTPDGEKNYRRAMGLNEDGTRNEGYPVYLNPTNLIDYVLNFHFVCDSDAPISMSGFVNNLYAVRNRVDGDGKLDGFYFLRHDAEHSMGVRGQSNADVDPTAYGTEGASADWLNYGNRFSPAELFWRLTKNPEFKMLVADLYYKHLLKEGGALTAPVAKARFEKRMAEIDSAVVAEAARWSQNRDNPWKYENWQNACNGRLKFIDDRGSHMLSQYRARGWYPSVDAAKAVNGLGGTVADGTQFGKDDRLYLTGGTQGKVYYTLDGSDPRLADGSVAASAIEYEGGSPVPVDVKAFDKGAEWKYFDAGSKPADDWMAADYDDSGWSSGNGRLGFAGSGTFGTKLNKYVGGGDSGTQVMTFYFRKEFVLPENAAEITALKVSLDCDDGYILYINGVEVKRDQVNSSEYTARATTTNLGEKDVELTVPAGLLKAGANVIAVEVHQCNKDSTDAWWDCALTYPVAGGEAKGLAVPPEGMTLTMRVLSSDGKEWSAIDSISVKGEEVMSTQAEAVRVAAVYSSTTDGGDVGEFVILTNVSPNAVDLTGVTFACCKHGDGAVPANLVTITGGRLEAGETVTIAQADYKWKKITNGKVDMTLTADDGTLLQKLYIDADWWNKRCDGTGIYFVAKEFGDTVTDISQWKPSVSLAEENLRFYEIEGIPAEGNDGAGEYFVLSNLSDSAELDLTEVKIVIGKKSDIEESGDSAAKCKLTLATGTAAARSTLKFKQPDYATSGWEKISDGELILKIYDADGALVQCSEVNQKNFAGYKAGQKALRATSFERTTGTADWTEVDLPQSGSKIEGDGFYFYLAGEFTEPAVIAPTGDTCCVVLNGATVPGLTLQGAGEFTILASNENQVASLSASAAKVTVEGDGALRFEGANTLVSVLDLTVKSGTFAVKSTGVSATKTPVVNVLGSVYQTGGTIDVDLDVATDLQIYGIYIANKDMDAKFSGGTLTAKVGGTKSAAIYGEKGSVNPAFSGDVAVSAVLTGPQARFVNAEGKIKISGGTFDISMPEVCDTLVDARVFKAGSEEKVKEILISGGTFTVNVPAPGSEIFSVDGTLDVSGGVLSLEAADDCFSATGDITISGGIVQAVSTAGDAIDSNGSVKIEGGQVFAFTCSADHDAIDVDPILTEESSPVHNLIIKDGATVVAVGGDQEHFHGPDEGSTATYVTATGLTQDKKYVLFSSVVTDETVKTTRSYAVNWNEKHPETFTLIIAAPGFDKTYSQGKNPADSDTSYVEIEGLDKIYVKTVEELAPADWPEDPDAEITDDTKPSDLGITEGAFVEATTDELKKLAKWAKANEVAFGGAAVNAMAFDADGNPATVFEESYLLNCAPTAEAVAEAKSEFKFDAIVPGEVPSIEGEFNGTVKVLGSATLGPDADWTANNKDARFYKAVLTR